MWLTRDIIVLPRLAVQPQPEAEVKRPAGPRCRVVTMTRTNPQMMAANLNESFHHQWPHRIWSWDWLPLKNLGKMVSFSFYKTIKIYKCKKNTQRERLQCTHDHHNVACVIRVWVCCVMEKATLSTILICHVISNLIKKSKSSYSKQSNNACDLLHVCILMCIYLST